MIEIAGYEYNLFYLVFFYVFILITVNSLNKKSKQKSKISIAVITFIVYLSAWTVFSAYERELVTKARTADGVRFIEGVLKSQYKTNVGVIYDVGNEEVYIKNGRLYCLNDTPELTVGEKVRVEYLKVNKLFSNEKRVCILNIYEISN